MEILTDGEVLKLNEDGLPPTVRVKRDLLGLAERLADGIQMSALGLGCVKTSWRKSRRVGMSGEAPCAVIFPGLAAFRLWRRS
jgi:hypothetical protein